MKTVSIFFLSTLLMLPVLPLAAQENADSAAAPVQNEERAQRPERMGRQNGGRNGGFDRMRPGFGGMRPGFGGPMNNNMRPIFGGPGMGSERLKAEDAIKAKFPQEFAALEQERKALEAKYQELAKKAEVKLPLTQEDQTRKMQDFQKKYEKELKEIYAMFRTDFKGASEKLQALYKAEGIEMPRFMGGFPGGNRPDAPKPEARSRRMDLNALEKAYPEEYKKVRELQKKNPREYRQALLELYRKYEAAQGKSGEKKD